MTKAARRQDSLDSEPSSSAVSGVGTLPNEHSQLPAQDTYFHQKGPDSISGERRLPVVRDLQSLRNLLDAEFEDVSTEVRLTELRQFVQHPPRAKHEASVESTATTTAQSRHEIALPSITTVDESTRDVDFTRDFVVPVSYVRTALTKESSRSLQLGRPFLYDLRQEDLLFIENLNSNIRMDELNRKRDVNGLNLQNLETNNALPGEHREGEVVSEIQLIAIIDSLEKLSKTADAIPFQIAWSRIKGLISSDFPLDTFSKIYEHWMGQRLRIGRPLLRPFWPIPPVSDNSPYAVFRSRQTDKMSLRRPRRVTTTTATNQKSQGATADLGNLLSILDLMKKRDRIKLALSITDSILFNQLRCETLDSDYVEPTWWLLKSRCRRALASNQQVTSNQAFAGIPLTGLSVIPTVDLGMILGQCFLSMEMTKIEDPTRLNIALLQCFKSFPSKRVSNLSICSFTSEDNSEEAIEGSPTSTTPYERDLCSFGITPLYRQQFFVRSFSKNLALVEKKQLFPDYESLDRHKMYLYDSLCAVENKRIQKRNDSLNQNMLEPNREQDRNEEDTKMSEIDQIQGDSPLPLKLVEGAVDRLSQALGFDSKDDQDFRVYLDKLFELDASHHESLNINAQGLSSQTTNQITPNTKVHNRKRKREPTAPDGNLPTLAPQKSPGMRSSERIQKLNSCRLEMQTPGATSPCEGQVKKPKSRQTRKDETVETLDEGHTQTFNTRHLNKVLGVQLPICDVNSSPWIPGGISASTVRSSLSYWRDSRASQLPRKSLPSQTLHTTPVYPSQRTDTPVTSLHQQTHQRNQSHRKNEDSEAVAEVLPNKKRRHVDDGAADQPNYSESEEDCDMAGDPVAQRVRETQEFLLAPDVAFPELFEDPTQSENSASSTLRTDFFSRLKFLCDVNSIAEFLQTY